MSLSLSGRRWKAPAVPYRVVLLAVAAAGAVAGFAVTGADASRAAVRDAGPELAHLLQMMALLKVVLAAGAVWLADWRLRQPLSPGLATAYLAGAGLMAMGPGMIWGMAHVLLGAALLHAGLATMIVLACTDGGIRWRLPQGHRRPSHAGPATPARPGSTWPPKRFRTSQLPRQDAPSAAQSARTSLIRSSYRCAGRCATPNGTHIRTTIG